MMRFGLGFLVCLGIIAYFTGFFSPMAYTRDVGRPQAQVMQALQDLDITDQPGAPGSTPQNGVQPRIRLEKAADRMTWFVMSGDKVAVAMTAHFEPLDNGAKTRVRASVERGDAPDDFVSPAFRSTGLTMGLFGIALEGELNRLTMPGFNPAKCAELLQRFQNEGIERVTAGGAEQPQNLGQAIGQTGKSMIRLGAMEAEMRRNGCPTDAKPHEAQAVQAAMDQAQDRESDRSRAAAPPQLGHDPQPTTQLQDDSGY